MYGIIYDNAVRAAWNVTYQGTSHADLYNEISNASMGKDQGKTMSIVQSTGTGKSRMVDEQAKLVFTIPLCIRDPQEEEYPPSDEDIFNYVRRFSQVDPAIVRRRMFRFLASLFREVRNELKDHITRQESYTALAQVWRVHLKENQSRKELYASVIRNARRMSMEKDMDESAAAEDELSLLLNKIDDLSDIKCDASKVKLVLYFDDAHTLVDYPKEMKGNDYFGILNNCCSGFTKYPIATIFISKKLSVAGVGVYFRPHYLWRVITEMPFDCSPDFCVAKNSLRWQDVSKVEFMARFGRPLFWAFLDTATQYMIRQLPDFVLSRLLCNIKIDLGANKYELIVFEALLDCRLLFEYTPFRKEALEKEIELVSDHMRLVYSVGRVQESRPIFSGYSSEPLIAEVAARKLSQFRRSSEYSWERERILRAFEQSFGSIEFKLKKPLLARYLLMLAYDNAVEAEYEQQDNSDPNYDRIMYSQGCSVLTFIQELYRANFAEVVMTSKPDNLESSETFSEAFKNARVRFTHFAKLDDDMVVTTEAMLAAFVRGMAFMSQDARAREEFDVILPVLLRDDEKLDEGVMSGIFISFRRRNFVIDAEELEFFYNEQPRPSGSTDEFDPARRPYISLLMELDTEVPLRRQAREYDASGHLVLSQEVKTSKQQVLEITSQYHNYSESTHPRYSIFAFGCSDAVYKVIKEQDSERHIYRTLLQSTTDIGFHLDRNPRATGPLLEMKPFWKAGAASFRWVDNEYLNNDQPAGMEETVVAGEYDEQSDDEQLDLGAYIVE